MNRWYNAIKTQNVVEIDLFDEIGGWGVYAKEFKNEVSELISNASEEVIVNINSPGGSVFEGIEIYNYLKGLENPTTVRINSLSASIATVIALGADTLQISESAFFMIHNPWSMAMGEADDMRKQADVLDKIKETILSIYEKNSNLDRERITALMDEETWLTGSEAVEYGFADELTEGVKVAAMATTDIINQFKNKPKELIMAKEENQEQEHTSILDKIKNLLNGEDKNTELNERYAELTEEVKALKESNDDFQATLKEQETTLEEAYNALKAEKEANAVAVADKQKEVEAKEEVIASKDEEITTLNAKIEELNAKLSEETGEDLNDQGKAGENEPKAKRSFADSIREVKNKK